MKPNFDVFCLHSLHGAFFGFHPSIPFLRISALLNSSALQYYIRDFPDFKTKTGNTFTSIKDRSYI